MLDINKLVTMRQGLNVERMHTIRHIQPYNNGFHSANAALIVIELAKLNNMTSPRMVEYMLLHDIAEFGIGDTPANAKRKNPDLKIAVDRAEVKWLKENQIHLPEMTGFEFRICKAADLYELGMFCIDEINMGNVTVNIVLDNVIKYLEELKDVKGVTDMISSFKEYRSVI